MNVIQSTNKRPGVKPGYTPECRSVNADGGESWELWLRTLEKSRKQNTDREQLYEK